VGFLDLGSDAADERDDVGGAGVVVVDDEIGVWSPGGLRNTDPALGCASGWLAMRRARKSLMRARAASPSPEEKRNQAAANHSSPRASPAGTQWR